ncbi:MAG: SufD family Fe-S cluster assembly protein [Alphaproteobacteria bacterium]
MAQLADLLALPKAAELPGEISAIGLPSAELEGWRWSGLRRSLPSVPFTPATAPERTTKTPSEDTPSPEEITFFDGHLGSTSEKHESVRIRVSHDTPVVEHSARRGEETPFPSLARTLATHPLRVDVAGQANDKPHRIRLIGTGTGSAAHHALDVNLAKDASFDCILASEAANEEARLVNSDCHFYLEAGASLRLLLLEDEAAQCFRVGSVRFTLNEGARVETFFVAQGASFQKLDIEAELIGAGAEFLIGGAHALAPGRQGEIALRVHHRLKETRSRNCFRAVVGARAVHNFQGRIRIERGADCAEAEMESKSLLMDESAKSRNKPELEIFHDNVACSHGVAVSQLDSDILFYLRSRGIREAEAMRLAVSAFLRQIFPFAGEDDALVSLARSCVERFSGEVL